MPICDFDFTKTTTRKVRCYAVKEIVLPDNGKWKFPLRKVLDRETREVKVLKTGLETHEVLPTEHHDEKDAEEEQNLGIELKPEVSPVPTIEETIPKELENSESPDTEPGQPLHSEAPPIGVPPPEEKPPNNVSPNKSFTYTHGPTIPEHPPER